MMGTNFYILGHKHDDSPEWHVGKRWAAGVYCHFCNNSLVPFAEQGQVMEKCPKCQTPRGKRAYNAAEIELGFAKASMSTSDIEMSSTSGFNWSMSYQMLMSKVSEVRKNHKYVIVDEYRGKYTWRQFVEMIKQCQLRSIDSIGKEFS